MTAQSVELVDLEPAARRLADLVAAVPDDLLQAPTPCPDYALGDLLEHIGGLAIAFTAAAGKVGGETTSRAPDGNADRLPADWRTRIPQDLEKLAAAWRDPSAWTGMTRVGGADLPGSAAGVFALDEIVVHGWDVAIASGQTYSPDQGSLAALEGLLTQMAAPDQQAAREGLFGPVIEVPEPASELDRVIGLTGRDPHWPGQSASRP
jgi:uncharacterized protein (TIGR03086 family)